MEIATEEGSDRPCSTGEGPKWKQMEDQQFQCAESCKRDEEADRMNSEDWALRMVRCRMHDHQLTNVQLMESKILARFPIWLSNVLMVITEPGVKTNADIFREEKDYEISKEEQKEWPWN